MSKSLADDLVSAINESAQHLSTATLTFMAVCVYTGIAVATTTHETLLMQKNIGLPLFDVEIPLDWFFRLAPSLLIFLHLHILLLVYLLQCKIRRYVEEPNPDEKETDLFFSSLPLSIMLGQKHPQLIRLFLLLLLTLVTVFLPLALLVSTQWVFLPARSRVTFWHMGFIFLDVILIWYFARQIREIRVHTLQLLKRDRPPFARARTFSLHAVLVLAILFSVATATGRSSSLSLADHVLVAKLPSTGEPSPDNVEGLNLRRRNLRQADFYRAVLINADFRGADLTGAVLRNADLRGAKFSSFQARMADNPVKTVLRDVDLNGARLERADLRADLRGAQLAEADLHGANLSAANLQGANLQNADLRGANLTRAVLAGANLVDAKLEGAILQHADLRFAKLVGADALGADFKGAWVLGADFRDAMLHFAEGLILDGVDLRRSRLGELLPECGEGTLKSPRHSDLRDVDFRPLTDTEWEKLSSSFPRNKAEDKIYTNVLERLVRLRRAPATQCLLNYGPDLDAAQQGIVQVRDADLLYVQEQLSVLVRDVPAPAIDEATYYQNLARRLINEACEDPGLAAALIKDISGEHAPWPWRPEDLVYRAAQRLVELAQDDRLCAVLKSLYYDNKVNIERAAERDPLQTQ